MVYQNIVSGSSLKLADVVMDHDFMQLGLLTVKQIKDGLITFVRPYTHTADFSWTGGVICYTGVEEFSHSIDNASYNYLLVSSKELD